MTRSIPKARSTGVELELNGEVARNWDLTANYSYDKTEIVEDNLNPTNVGNRLVNAPTNMGGLYLSHRMTLPVVPGEVRVGGGARYVGRRAGDPENSFTMPAYTVADAFVARQQAAWQTYPAETECENLFNREYYASSAGNLRVIEGEPRSLSLRRRSILLFSGRRLAPVFFRRGVKAPCGTSQNRGVPPLCHTAAWRSGWFRGYSSKRAATPAPAHAHKTAAISALATPLPRTVSAVNKSCR